MDGKDGVKLCMCNGHNLHYNFGSRHCEELEVKIMHPETRAEVNLAEEMTRHEITSFKLDTCSTSHLHPQMMACSATSCAAEHSFFKIRKSEVLHLLEGPD